MISLVIFADFSLEFYLYSRGIVLQTYYTISAIVSAIIPGLLYQSLGKQINLLVPYASARKGHLRIFPQVANCSSWTKVFYAGLAYLRHLYDCV